MNDAGTGIQRLVKSLWTRLPAQNHSINFVPLYATRKKKYAISHYPNANIKKRNYVHLKTGDLFFGLDWSADQIIQHQAQLFEWKMCGTKMVFILNDILALQHPDWFTKKNSQKLKAWLKVVAVCADEIICVSQTVKGQIEQWLLEHGIADLPCSSIQLGGEIAGRNLSEKLRDHFQSIYLKHTYLLKVSTIEPRKGHLCLIQAFEALYKQYPDFPHQLYLVGRYGWKSDDTIHYLKQSPFYGKRIFWFDDINDVELNQLYQSASGVINASYGEGFGLPLMEAIYHKKPLLVRDIAVFREVSSNQATYFQNDAPYRLAQTIFTWAKDLTSESQQIIPVNSWDDAAKNIINIMEKHGVKLNIS